MAWNLRARKVPTRGARKAWDGVIDVWDDFVESGKDWSRIRIHGRVLLQTIGPVRGLSVLDVGCGQGHFSRLLAGRGGRVTGIDWSRRMIEQARHHEARKPLGITYRHLDARRLALAWSRPHFDLAVASMSLMDMPDLPSVLKGVRGALRPEGRWVFSVTHPVNTSAVRWQRPSERTKGALLIDGYFEEGPLMLDWTMRRLKRPFRTVFWHRTLESWFRELRNAGFEIEQLKEPRARPQDVRAVPALETARRLPFYLVFDCRKLPPPRGRPTPSARPRSHSRQRGMSGPTVASPYDS